jgi:hypothetical protein
MPSCVCDQKQACRLDCGYMACLSVCLAPTYQLYKCNSWKQLGTTALKLLVISVKYPREVTVQCVAGGGGAQSADAS